MESVSLRVRMKADGVCGTRISNLGRIGEIRAICGFPALEKLS